MKEDRFFPPFLSLVGLPRPAAGRRGLEALSTRVSASATPTDGYEEARDPQQDGEEVVGHRDPCDEKSQADENQGHTTTDMAGRGAREPTLLTLERLGKFGVILMELRFQVPQDLLLSL